MKKSELEERVATLEEIVGEILQKMRESNPNGYTERPHERIDAILRTLAAHQINPPMEGHPHAS